MKKTVVVRTFAPTETWKTQENRPQKVAIRQSLSIRPAVTRSVSGNVEVTGIPPSTI